MSPPRIFNRHHFSAFQLAITIIVAVKIHFQFVVPVLLGEVIKVKALFNQILFIYNNGCFFPIFQQLFQYTPVPFQDIIDIPYYRFYITVETATVMIAATARSIAKLFIDAPCNGLLTGQTVLDSHYRKRFG